MTSKLSVQLLGIALGGYKWYLSALSTSGSFHVSWFPAAGNIRSRIKNNTPILHPTPVLCNFHYPCTELTPCLIIHAPNHFYIRRRRQGKSIVILFRTCHHEILHHRTRDRNVHKPRVFHKSRERRHRSRYASRLARRYEFGCDLRGDIWKYSKCGRFKYKCNLRNLDSIQLSDSPR